MSRTYLNFDLVIQRGEGQYTARVVDSPAGQAAATFRLPFTDVELENFCLRVGRSRRQTRRIDSPEVEEAKRFGERLYATVFDGDVRACLRSSLDEARRQRSGLRIRLRLMDAPEMGDVPWEYLYNASLNRFLGLSVETPIVRFLDLPERIDPLPVVSPLRVLVMISSPLDHPELDVEQEWTRLNEAVADVVQRGLLELHRLPRATLATLQQTLRRGEYHVFHFVGHGGFDARAQDGILILEDDARRGRPIGGQNLGLMLHDERSIRLVVLNACEGARASKTDPFAGVAQSLVQQGLAAVIAMQFEITDGAAITFAHEFYGALADGYPADAALAEARKSIFAQDNGLEWGTPVLYLRAPDGRVFDVDTKTATPRPASQPQPTESPPVVEPPTIPPPSAPAPVAPIPVAPVPLAPTTDGRREATPAQRPGRWLSARTFWPITAITLVLFGVVAMLTIGRPPDIQVFEADRTEATIGQQVNLKWSVANATSIAITDALESASLPTGEFRPPAGSGVTTIAFTKRGSHDVTLWARGRVRSSERTLRLVVRFPAPKIDEFLVPASVGQGQKIALRWRVSNVTKASIEPQPGAVAIPAGTAQVDAPSGQREVTFRLVVSNDDSPAVERRATVRVAPRPPSVQRFSIDPDTIERGQPAILAWNAPGADKITIVGIGAVAAPSGSLTVRPTKTTRYLLVAENAGGADRAENTLVVQEPVSFVPTLVAPTQNAVLDNGCSTTPEWIRWAFRWSPVPGATEYQLLVQRQGSANPAINASGLTATAYQYTRQGSYVTDRLLDDWRWRVRARVNGTWQDWSPEWPFRVEPPNTDC